MLLSASIKNRKNGLIFSEAIKIIFLGYSTLLLLFHVDFLIFMCKKCKYTVPYQFYVFGKKPKQCLSVKCTQISDTNLLYGEDAMLWTEDGEGVTNLPETHHEDTPRHHGQ